MIFFTDSKRTFDKIWYPIMIKSLRRLGKKENIFKLIKLFIKNIQLSVQLLSHVWLFATPWIAACQASLSSPTPNYSNSCPLSQWCHPTISSSVFPLLPSSIFPSIRVFSSESDLRIRWPKYWSFSFNISPSNEHPGLVSFRMDWLDLLAVQGTLKTSLEVSPLSTPLFKTTVQKHQFFSAQLSLQSNSHNHTWLLEKPQLWLDRSCWLSNVSAF